MTSFKELLMSDFEPNIIAFVCNWCTYAAADLAGTSRMQYPPNVKIIRLMCSGAVDPIFVMKPLLEGADGVLVGGCHPGDCHYGTGNYKARRRMKILNTILENAGIDTKRVWLRWISASEGKAFAKIITEMVDELKKIGPNPLKTTWDI
jgi:F420-non-reducing hydrogenase iron-sulfur subunit